VTEESEIQNYSDKINVSYFVAKKRAWVSGGLGAISSLASDACILLALWYGGQMIFQGVITTGDLISYMLFALQSVFAFQALLSIFPQFMEAIGASVRVFELLDRVPRVNYEGGQRLQSNIEGRVTFEDVHFKYHTPPRYISTAFLYRFDPMMLGTPAGRILPSWRACLSTWFQARAWPSWDQVAAAKALPFLSFHASTTSTKAA